jgi:hypothetical protein
VSTGRVPATNLFQEGTLFDLYVYVSEQKEFGEFHVSEQDFLTKIQGYNHMLCRVRLQWPLSTWLEKNYRTSQPGIEPTVGGEHSRKEPFEQLVNGYSEHLHRSAQSVENARDSTIHT